VKIKYKKKKLFFDLLSGLFWTGMAIDSIVGNENVRWTKYVMLLLGLVYLTTFIFKTTQQYLTIENGTIQLNEMLGSIQKINLDEIIQIIEFDGDYILITENKKMKVYTEEIDTKSLMDLKNILSKLVLPHDKTPFYN
jgi:hydrogenase maturation factor